MRLPAADDPPAALTVRAEPLPTPHAEALRAWARGTHPAAAAVEFLLDHDVFLRRDDFTANFINDGNFTRRTPTASIDWAAAITALDSGNLPCSGGEARALRLAASLADGTPVDLRAATVGIDARTATLLSRAIMHAAGHPPPNRIPETS